MDAFASFFDSRGNRWRHDSFKNLRQISPVVQNHLKKVYTSLCCALVASAIGSFLHVQFNIGGFLTAVGSMCGVAWLLSTPAHDEAKRVWLLMASAFLQGASIGPLIKLAIDFDPSILVGAFVGCSLAFGCFSAAAMVARRREYLYLGALLSSGLSMLTWLHFASSVFGGSLAALKFQLYIGLLVFVGYVVYDTQAIIEEAHLGNLDYVKHALSLYTDFVAVFVRILIIMIKNKYVREEKKKKRRRS